MKTKKCSLNIHLGQHKWTCRDECMKVLIFRNYNHTDIFHGESPTWFQDRMGSFYRAWGKRHVSPY